MDKKGQLEELKEKMKADDSLPISEGSGSRLLGRYERKTLCGKRRSTSKSATSID